MSDRQTWIDPIPVVPGPASPGRDPDLGLGDDVEVVAELGRGARTVVYRVRRGGRDYAVKMLRRSLLIGDQDRAAFCREAALLARVNDPGVPQVFDVGTANGRPYLVQEYVGGRSLARVLEAGPQDEPVLLRLATDVATALDAAHRAGLVHRDVKPANILMTPDGRARLIDFGLACVGGGPTDDSVVGTLQYTAPEQAGMLSRSVDGRADLYALGVVLFRCATGELPFEARDVGELFAQHASSPVPDPRALRPQLSAGTATAIVRLLAKDPDDRFQSAAGLLAALPGAGPAGSRPVPLAGRQEERADLVRRWEQARAGHGGVALVAGAPGAGKSHLARAVVEDVRASGGLVLVGKCERDSPLPLAPLRAAVEGHLRAVAALPPVERDAAVQRLRDAAGAGAPLLRPLSPALAVLLDAPRLPEGERHEQFVNAVAVLLTELVGPSGGLLVIDDVQWLDAATRAVLHRVMSGIAGLPLLVLATSRDDRASLDGLRAFEADAGELLDLRVCLDPLDDAGTAELVSWYLAGATVGSDVTAEVTSRGHGNPFTILEYLRALTDTGALRPSWGTWRLDDDVLRAIDLPRGVMELILARIDGLGARSRAVLTSAAAMGATVDARLLAEVTGTDVTAALADAAAHGLLRGDAEGFAFVHDRIREALLSAGGPPALAALHQRIAEVLDDRGPGGAAAVYATARHYAQGETHRRPQRVYGTGWAAGQLALDESAPDAAVAFLEAAARAAAEAGIAPDSRFREALGAAYWLTGRIEPAREQLEAGLADETDPVRRAALRLQLAHVLRTNWQLNDAIACVRLGLAELGRPVPDNPVVFGLATAATLGRWLVRGSRPPSARPAQGEEAERLRLFALLCRAASSAAAINLQNGLLVAFNVRAAPVAHRLGPTTAYVHHLAGVGSIAGSLRMRRRREQIFERALRIATELGDPKAYANALWFDAFAKVLGRDMGIKEWNEVSESQRDWLEVDFYTNIVLMRARDLLQRGYAVEALAWHDHGCSRVSTATRGTFPGFAVLAAMAQTLLGRTTDAPAVLAARAAEPLDAGHAVQFALGAMQTSVEQDELGGTFDAAMRAVDGLRVSVSAMFPEYRMIFAHETFGRLTRCRRAEGTERTVRLAEAQTALRRLRRAASGSDPSADPTSMAVLQGYYQVARAGLCQLRGEDDKALTLLAGTAKPLRRLDAPLVEYEAARIRARAMTGLGEDALASRAVGTALALARRYGWSRRERWVRVEFAEAAEAHPGSLPPSGYRTAGTAGADRSQRRLAALQQVSTAAARVLDPQQLARVALDETLHILGAERAVLFLADEEGALRPDLGRDASGGDLVQLDRYSTTLVDRAAAERVPLVVTGSEEGAALGSESAVLYGLRSIMVAPLELDERLIGVVYLDSRVAKGVFTDADIEILTAVTSHIAVSLETARAAQLEIAVRSAHEQRDTAELLRYSIQELTATLDPAGVLERLLSIVAQTVHADRVCLVHRHEDELILSDLRGGGGEEVDVDALLAIDETCHGDRATGAPPGVAGVLGQVAGWLAVPLVTRGHGRGVLLAGVRSTAFTRTHVDVVSALALEGGIAYDNARLFAQVQQMATTDALTGVHNRRHFTDLAAGLLGVALRNGRPLAAMMVDIDHFKRVNDTHGHSCGDEVIRAVAKAMQDQVRDVDLLGRYGGEEFAVVLGELNAEPREVAERLRSAVAGTPVPAPGGPIRVTISVGVAELGPDDDLDRLLARADEALYRAKQAGRNRVRHG